MKIILFDGECNLCSAVVTFIIKRDKKALFRFAAIQSGVGQILLKSYAVKENSTTLYYLRDKVCFRKSTAMLLILKDLGGVWKCFYPLIVIPSCIRDAVYLFVSRNRYRVFGKRKYCMVTTSDLKNRFIESVDLTEMIEPY